MAERQETVPAAERQETVPANERQETVPADERQETVPAPEKQDSDSAIRVTRVSRFSKITGRKSENAAEQR